MSAFIGHLPGYIVNIQAAAADSIPKLVQVKWSSSDPKSTSSTAKPTTATMTFWRQAGLT